jgi:hypothetical protein
VHFQEFCDTFISCRSAGRVHEDDAVVAEEFPGQADAGVPHTQPLGMEVAIRLFIRGGRFAFAADLAGALQVFLQRLLRWKSSGIRYF